MDGPAPSGTLRFSILIPLEEHRGQALDCVRRWTSEQTFPRADYEIVVAAPTHPGSLRSDMEQIRALLSPHDRLIERAASHDQDLCVEAAAVARGELLFFTEAHCLPEPETLERADEVARSHPDWVGFSCRSLPTTHNLLSEIEARFYQPDIDFGMTQHAWRKVLDQCFVVRRTAYHEAGGFDPSFGHFAEWLLAARLHLSGAMIGYAPEASVCHFYSGDFGEWRRFTEDFIDGQMRFLASDPDESLLPMFDEVPEWSSRHDFRRLNARRMCRLLLHDLRTTRGRDGNLRGFGQWRVLGKWSWRALAGPSTGALTTRFGEWSARCRLRADLIRRDKARVATGLVRCCEAIAARRRRRFIRRWAGGAGSSATDRPTQYLVDASSGSWRPGDPWERHGVGFHLASGRSPDVMRWSEPAAFVELPLQPGAQTLRIGWLFPPPVKARPRLSFYIDERLVPSDQIRITEEGAELQVDVPASLAPTRLGWVCAGWRGDSDDRLLGLPVTHVEWARAGSSAILNGQRQPVRSRYSLIAATESPSAPLEGIIRPTT